MSRKYSRLQEHLLSLQQDVWHATFADIEAMLGFKLPNSARNHQAWWANERRGGASQKQAWHDAGWRTENLNLTASRVDFRRDRSPKAKPTATMAESAPRANSPATELSLHWVWLELGSVSHGDDGRLVFPRFPAAPAVYRFLIARPGGIQSYVGESDNLFRRFGNYRHPGPTQQTSIRINSEFRSALGNPGTRITIDIAHHAKIALSAQERPLNLARKPERRLLEQAVLVTTAGESLNR